MPRFWNSAVNTLDSHLHYLVFFFKAFSPSSGRYICSVVTFSLCNWKSHQFRGFLQMQFSWREKTKSRKALTLIWVQILTFPYTYRSHSCRYVYIWAVFSQPLRYTKCDPAAEVGRCFQQLSIQVKIKSLLQKCVQNRSQESAKS